MMTEQEYAILAAELRDDPLGRGYAAMSDEEVAQSLAVKDRSLPDSERKTMRSVLENVTDAGPLISQLDALAANDPFLREGLAALRSYAEGGGLDFSSSKVAGMIQQLHAAGVVTGQQRDELLALGQRSVSRAEELGIPEPTPHQVSRARQM